MGGGGVYRWFFRYIGGEYLKKIAIFSNNKSLEQLKKACLFSVKTRHNP